MKAWARQRMRTTAGPPIPSPSTSRSTLSVSPRTRASTDSRSGSIAANINPSSPSMASVSAIPLTGIRSGPLIGHPDLVGLDLHLPVGAGVDRPGGADEVARPGQRVGAQVGAHVD